VGRAVPYGYCRTRSLDLRTPGAAEIDKSATATIVSSLVAAADSVCLTEDADDRPVDPVGVPLDERVIHVVTYDLAAVRRWGQRIHVFFLLSSGR
jgi:hypothetical protein